MDFKFFKKKKKYQKNFFKNNVSFFWKLILFLFFVFLLIIVFFSFHTFKKINQETIFLNEEIELIIKNQEKDKLKDILNYFSQKELKTEEIFETDFLIIDPSN